jgi:hypothetical protein
MAYQNTNLLLSNLHGALGKQLVIKQYKSGTVVTKFPDMSRVRKSRLQEMYQERFARAVAYAQSIIRNPEKKRAYARTVRKGKPVYYAAIREYLHKNPL